MAVNNVLAEPIKGRSDALELFKRINYPDSPINERERLEGWYEYIYQKSLAEHVGASLNDEIVDGVDASDFPRSPEKVDESMFKIWVDSWRSEKTDPDERGFGNLIYVSNGDDSNGQEKTQTQWETC
ncbi:hypothetical protein OZX74_01670 [Bifidobacterium sp. ESL0798]|uniref:hypothetical protein n=1 Tax=Bifidobacterium sp. ESL0798 TaxID=2983235 RepID=UPI0023F8A9B3|nr:hypothetical protein [Bifidobacterium sp. ESL0798]WEV74292.1 hypothetical protein OZX74_01670 [Bifidobacterium sp. ESL0798]